MFRVLDAVLSSGRWWRWLRGGHWERWYIDSPVNLFCWLRVGECFHTNRRRPLGAAGLPACETRRA